MPQVSTQLCHHHRLKQVFSWTTNNKSASLEHGHPKRLLEFRINGSFDSLCKYSADIIGMFALQLDLHHDR